MPVDVALLKLQGILAAFTRESPDHLHNFFVYLSNNKLW